MRSESVSIVNKLGLHARAAAVLVKTASRFSSEVRLARDDKTVNAKSIMSVMMLAAAQGTTLTLETEGPDEDEAFSAVSDLIADRFGEPE